MDPNVKVVKVSYVFEDVPLINVVDALCDIQIRAQWDSTITSCNVIRQIENNFQTFSYLMEIPELFQDQRDFVEKQIVFRVDDTVYMYASSISDTYAPPQASAVRGDTIFSCFKITQSKGLVLITSASQREYNLTISSLGVDEVLIKKAITFKDELSEQASKT